MDTKIQQQEKKGLYGGAMEIEIPTRFIDVSQFRQVPDHQEVFVDETSDQSVIIELLERQSHIEDNKSASFHFDTISDESDIPADGRIVFNHRPIDSAEMPHFTNETPKFLLFGQQKVAKFNETGSENIVNVYMAIVRLSKSQTDVLITLYHPILLCESSSSAKTVGSTKPDTLYSQPIVEQTFIKILQSFNIKDYSLFVHQ
ncbi:Ran GTPase binding protein [Cavenderia fasciculata]|uniref:Ran GTPase binding protein n=1 Tax=Cavenderia fasciculata TaxID=261658 RepID=F4Q0P6_CACFS|nr:Ran GTPase binding protein [Cavenderia fasciculata]EGG18397.1 Ran GTPase binding protein [Cavenderia fasciculata]|eukprot:XP_004366301.1 Ran GTPase binding protein [Cavenderia fasciculata]